jgi:hypothetical protein
MIDPVFNNIMVLYSRFAGSQFGSSLIFGGALFAATIPSGGIAEAVSAGALAAASWFATHPLLKHVIGGIHGA